MRDRIRVSGVHDELGSYSHAVEDDHGLIQVSGQAPVDEAGQTVGGGDMEAQTRQVMENLAAVLESAGAGLADVTKMTAYLTDGDAAAAFGRGRAPFLTEPYPASTVVVVSALLDERWMVEVDAVARRS